MKTITITTQREDEFIPLERARQYIRGLKPGSIISRDALLNKIYRGEFPPGTYTKTARGNYFFSKNFLMGFKPEKIA